MNAAGAAPMSMAAFEAMTGHLRLEQEVGGYEAAARLARASTGDVASRSNGGDAARHGARVQLARLLNCDADEIALAESAQQAWAKAFYSLDFVPSDRIFCFSAEYAGNAVAFLHAQKRLRLPPGSAAALLEVLSMRHDGLVDVDALHSHLAEARKHCRRCVVALTHVGTDSSIVQPVLKVGELCHEFGALYLLDACQSVGQLPVDVRSIGCDFCCGTGRKWLRGPRGTGFLYMRKGAFETFGARAATSTTVGVGSVAEDHANGLLGEPAMLDGNAADWISPSEYRLPKTARRYEFWESNVAGFAGLAAAVQFCCEINPSRIQARSAMLATRLREKLDVIEGVELRDAPTTFDELEAARLGAGRCAIVLVGLKALDQQDGGRGLDAAKLNSTLAGDQWRIGASVMRSLHNFESAQRARPAVLRLSPSYFTTEAEIDRVVEAVRAILN